MNLRSGCLLWDRALATSHYLLYLRSVLWPCEHTQLRVRVDSGYLKSSDDLLFSTDEVFLSRLLCMFPFFPLALSVFSKRLFWVAARLDTFLLPPLYHSASNNYAVMMQIHLSLAYTETRLP